MGIEAITCDTVRRDHGRSGGFVNGPTIGFATLAQTFDDPENARVILLSAGGLVLLGVLIAAGTVWWWRSSEVEHPALGPLEVMGSRSWWKGDYALRRRRLEEARPAGADPTDAPATSTSEPVDLEAAALASPREFDDLLEFPIVVEELDDEEANDAESDAEVLTSTGEPLEAADPISDDEARDEADDEADDEVQDDTAATVVAPVLRPIDPLLRLQHGE